jgi:hypothetical protein
MDEYSTKPQPPINTRVDVLFLTGQPGIQVDNDQRPLNEVAREILERAGWPCPPA